MKQLLLALFCLFSFIVNAQTHSAKSDLGQILDSAQSKLDASDYNALHSLLDKAHHLLDTNTPKEQRYRYQWILGSCFFETRNLSPAEEAFNEALIIATQLKDSIKMAGVYSNKANIQTLKGNYEEGLKDYKKALSYYRDKKNKRYMAALMNMGQAYTGLNQYDKTLSLLMQAKNFFAKTEDYENMAIAENNIGEVYRNYIRDNDKARIHYRMAIQANQKAHNKPGLAQNYHNLSAAFLDREQPDSAMVYAMRSRQIKQEIGDDGGMAASDYNLGSIYRLKGDYKQAIIHFSQSLEASKKNQVMEGIYFNSLSLGQVYFEMGRYQQSNAMLQQALEIARQSGQLDLQVNVYTGLYELNKKQSHSAEALQYYEYAQQLKDSIASVKNQQHLEELRTQYEANLAQAENDVLREKEKIQAIKLNSQQKLLYLSVASIILLLLVGIWLIRALRQRKLAFANEKKSNAELEVQNATLREREEELAQANDLKNKILSVLGHDLRSPLASISGLLSTMSATTITREELQQVVGYLKKDIEVSLNTLQEILVWARLQMDEVGKMMQRIDPEALVEEVLVMYEPNIRAKALQIKTEVSQPAEFWADRNQMRSILGNLLSNAIKFSPEEEEIFISFEEDREHIKISLHDRGAGIPQEVLHNLNQRNELISNQGTSGERGTGIGLRIVKDFIDAHQGTLFFKNNQKGGTTAEITIPKRGFHQKKTA